MADGEIEREEEVILTETAIDAEWKRIQKKTFTRWCNEHLKKVCPDKLIEEIGEDFQDGIRLILLLEVISQKKVGRYNKKPKVYAQQMENIEKALNFITKTEKIYLVNIGSGDIHNGNVKLILGLIWTLIQHYQISVGFGIEGGDEKGKESGKTGKQALLEWLQKELPGKNISNFTKDWNDGTNIAALVDAKAPGLCPEHVDMDPKNAHENAAHAMKLAEDWLSVPMLLGPEDMVNPHVDELSMMTYLSQYPEAKLKEGAPIKVKEEPVQAKIQEDVMSKPELIKVGELHVPAEAGSGEDVWVEIDCSDAGQDKIKAECKGQTKIPVDVEEIDSNKYRVKFTPTRPDVYSLSILYGDNLIPDGAIEVNLLPKTDSKMVKHLGTFIPDDPADPVVLKFDASKAGKGEMRARVSGVLIARTVDSEVKCADEEMQKYEISFVPSGADQYNVDVYWSNKTIPGSPIYVNIVYAHEVRVSDPDGPIELLYPVVVQADTKNAGPGVLSASCSGDETGDVDVEIAIESPDKTKYKISFRPLEADHYSLRVFFDDVEIKHSPVRVEVLSNFKPELVKVGDLHVPEKAGSGEDVWVEIDCSEAGKGDVTVECKGTTDSLAVKIEETDLMKYRVTFNPTQPDIYSLKILHGDSIIPGGEFDINLLPKADPKKVQHLGTFIPDDPADPVILKFDASKAGDGEIRARVNGVLMAGPVDSEVKCVNEETKDYEVSFLPTKADTYDVDVYWSDESIPTSPISVKIVRPDEVLVAGPDGPLETLQPVKVHVDTQYAGPGVLTASCSGKEAGNLEVEMIRNEADNTKYDLSFRPVEADSYSLRLFFDNTEIKDSPIKVEISPKFQPELVKVGPLHVPEKADSGDNVWVEIDCSEAGRGEVKAECRGHNQSPTVEIELSDPNKYRIKFNPTKPDIYNLSITYGDSVIPGGAFEINLLPKSDSTKVKHLGTSIPDDSADPVILKFDASKAGDGEMRARVNGVLMAGPVDSEVKCVNEDTQEYEVSFLPAKADTYDVDVYWSDKSIPTSPISVKIVRPHEVLVSGPDGPLETLQPVKVHVDTQYAGPGVLTASCSGNKDRGVDVEIIQNEADNTKYDVSFRPKKADSYALKLFFDNTEIKNSPVQVEVIPKFQPELVTVGTLHVPEKAGSGGDVWVDIDCSDAGKGEVKAECKGQLENPDVEIKQLDTSRYRVKFTPAHPDLYTLNIRYGDSSIPGGTFDINLLPKCDSKMVKHLGTFIPDNDADPVILKFDASKAGEGEMRARVNGALLAGPVDSDVKCVDEETKDYEVSFLPTKADTYDVDVYWSDESIPTSPISVKIVRPDEVLVSGPDGPLETLQPVKVNVNTQYAGPGVLTASCSGKDAGNVYVEIIRNEVDNTKYDVSFRPVLAGPYSLKLFFDKTEIKRSPVELEVSAKFNPKLVKIGKLHVPDQAGSGEDVWVEIDCSEAGRGDVKAECKGQKENPDTSIEALGNMKYQVKFNPTHPDIYALTILYGDSLIPGGKFDINLLPKTDSKMVKHLDTFLPDDSANPVILKFDTSKAGKGEMRAHIKSGMAGSVDPKVKCVNEEAQEYEVSFVPKRADTYDVEVLWSGEAVPDSPFSVKIIYPHKVLVTGPDGPPELLQAVKVHVNTQYAGPGTLSALCSGKEAGDMDIEMTCNEVDNTKYDVAFLPVEADSYSLRLFFNNVEIKDSPVKVEVSSNFKPELVKVGELHVPAKAGTGEDVWVEIDCSEAGKGEVKAKCNGRSKIPVSIEEFDPMKYRIKFTPKTHDLYGLTILYGDSIVPDGAFEIDLLQKPDSKMVKHLDTIVPDNRAAPVILKFDASKAGKGEMHAHVNGVSKAKPVDSKVKCINDMTDEYEVSFVPSGADTYSVNVFWSSQAIPSSPICVKIVYPDMVLVSGPDDPLEPLEPVNVHVDTQYAGPGVLTASCSGTKTGKVDDVKMTSNEDDSTKHNVCFYPAEPDLYSLRLFFDNTEIKHSPVDIDVKKNEPVNEQCDVVLQQDTETMLDILIPAAEPDVVEEKPTELDMEIGDPLTLLVDSEEDDAKSILTATASGRRVGEVPLSITQNDDRSYSVVLDPTEPDIYTLEVKMDDSHVPSSPFIINYTLPKKAELQVILEPEVQILQPRVRIIEQQDEVPTHPITKPYLIQYVPEDGVDNLTAYAIHDDSCTRYVLTIRTKKEGTTLLVFNAEKTGLHFIHIQQGGKEIHGSPFKLLIVPSDPSACFVVDVPEKSYVGEESTIMVDASKAGAGSMEVKAAVPVGGNGTQFLTTELGKGQHQIQFTPKVAGKHMLTIYWEGVPIPASPVPVNVHALTEEDKQARDAASRVSVHNSPVFSSELDHTKGAKFVVHTAKAGQGELAIKSKGPGDVRIDVIKQKVDGNYKCRVRPAVSGKYDLEILWNGFPIHGSPFQLDFTSNKTYIINELNLEAEKLVVDKTYEYKVDCNKHEGELEILANPSDCAHVDAYRLKDNIYKLKITPQMIGNHEISLKFAGKHLFRSPYHVQFDATEEEKPELDFNIQDKFLRLSDIDFSIDLSDPILEASQPPIASAPLPKQKLLEDAEVTAFGPGLEDGIIGQEGNFTIKTDGCGDGKLVVAIDGPRGTFKTCLRHHPDHERTVLARYDPTHIGKYTINIKWMDKHIQGSPFVVEITPQ